MRGRYLRHARNDARGRYPFCSGTGEAFPEFVPLEQLLKKSDAPAFAIKNYLGYLSGQPLRFRVN
ncbi:MAG: hypothetical protein K6E37_03150 [Bacteroidales bacterium]|nr:hypothetical protein [Bacteroidales bacterium]